MRFVRYGEIGKEKPGLIDREGPHPRSVGYVADITRVSLSDMSFKRR